QSNGTGGDKLGDFVRYAITTLLNDVGVPDFNAPSDVLADIADWLIQFGPRTELASGSYVLNYNNSKESGKDGFFGTPSTIKASSVAWQTGRFGIPSGSDIFAAMNALTDSALNNAMAVSQDGSLVFSGVNYGDYFGIRAGTLNIPDGYLSLV
ncbi:MAG: hypothetical protein ACM3VT_12265, partial [Solirubrobacterales bacterium]